MLPVKNKRVFFWTPHGSLCLVDYEKFHPKKWLQIGVVGDDLGVEELFSTACASTVTSCRTDDGVRDAVETRDALGLDRILSTRWEDMIHNWTLSNPPSSTDMSGMGVLVPW